MCVTLCPHGRPTLRANACSGVPPGSLAVGVPQPASDETAVSVSATPRDQRIPELSASSARGVGQAASFAIFGNSAFPTPADPRASHAIGVGHPMQSLSDVRRTEARRAQIDRPEGIARRFHVSLYKVEPSKSVRARNLFANCHDRSERRSEGFEHGPKMSFVFDAFALTGRAPWLAGEAGGPERTPVWPSGLAGRVAPDAETGEEMTLPKPGKVSCPDFPNVALIDHPRCDQPARDQLAQRCGRLSVRVVVVGAGLAHAAPAATSRAIPIDGQTRTSFWPA
jgi:hypothetical protein